MIVAVPSAAIFLMRGSHARRDSSAVCKEHRSGTSADRTSQHWQARSPADGAEREVDEWRKAVFIAARLGEEFDGLIINVRDFGFFVELEDFFIEGLVAVATLTDDYYQFDERRHTLVGRRGGRAFRLGDRVRVRVERVNTDRHLVDFSVITSVSPSRQARRR